MNILFCKEHSNENIFRYCLNQNCKIEKKICPLCIQEKHLDHPLDCLNIECIKWIFINSISKLEEFQCCLSKFDDPLQCIIELKETVKSQLQQLGEFKNFGEDQMYLIKTILILSSQCYNNEIEIQLRNKIYQLIMPNKQLLEDVITIFNSCYSKDYLNYKFLILAEKGNILFERKQFQESIYYYECALKLNKRNDILYNYYIALVSIDRSEQALAFFKQHANDLCESMQQFLELCHKVGDEKFNKNNKNNPFVDHRLTNLPIDLAIQLQDHGCYNQSNKVLEEVLRVDPSNDKAIEYFVKNLIGLKQFGKAKQFCDDGLQQQINNNAYQNAKIICLLSNPEYYKEDQVNIEECNEQSKCHYAYTLYLNKKYDEAIKVFESIPPSNEFYYWYAQNIKKQILVQLGHTQEAFQIPQVPIPQGNNQFSHNLINYLSNIQQRNYEAALENIEKILEIAQNSKLFLFFKGYTLFKLNRKEQALSYIEVIYQLGAKQPSVLQLYAMCLFINDKFDNSLNIINEILKENPNTYEIELLKGQILYFKQHFQESLVCFNNCIKLQSKLYKSHSLKSMVLIRLKQYNDAIKSFNLSLSLNPTNIISKYNRAIVLFKIKQYEQAFQSFQEVLTHLNAKQYSFYCLIQMKQYTKAKDLLNELSLDDQLFKNIHFLKGQVLYCEQNYFEAVQCFEKIDLTLCTQNKIYLYALSLIEIQQFGRAEILLHEFQCECWHNQLIQGYLLHNQKQYDKALSKYSSALIGSQQIYILQLQANILHQLQRIDEALKIDKQISEISNQDSLQVDPKDKLLQYFAKFAITLQFDLNEIGVVIMDFNFNLQDLSQLINKEDFFFNLQNQQQ